MLWLLILLILIACSSVISGSETALFALTPQDRRAFADSTSRVRRLAAQLMRRPRRVLMTVLIVNTAVNVAFFAVSFVGSSKLGSGHPATRALGGAAALVAIIICGEILPKAVALANARMLAPLVAPVVHTLQWLTAPIAAVLQLLLVEPIVRLLRPGQPPRPDISTGDLSALVELSANQGIITTREHDMLQTVVALPDISVRSIMVPRVHVHAVPLDAPRSEIEAAFREHGLTKLPVYGHDLDDIQGLLYARDLYLQPDEPIERLLREVRYVPEVINLLQLVRHFRRTGTQIAVVVDEHGGVAGLVTIEDVLAEIVGDLDTDEASGPPEVERIDDRTYRVPGALSVRAWRPLLGLTDQMLEVDTFGGVVVAALGRLPHIGDSVRFGNLTLTVDRLDQRRVDRVLLRALPTETQGGQR
ncbi:MAG TPA: hemolysin family protein [Phycisphaerae bacterium]|nr:hemolysin family protein [Phycisphaerae bacterium]